MSKSRLNTTIITLFLLSATVFVFNALPSVPAIDDSDQQISAPSTNGNRAFIFLIVVPMGAARAVVRKRAWGSINEQKLTSAKEGTSIKRIARGPPEMLPTII
mgnify:FL=1